MAKSAKDGALRFDLPFGAPAPRLVNPERGIARIVARRDQTYEIAVTLLDAPDHRLLRAGVVLAHRVLAGEGEWYLSGPGWQPYLPAERVEAFGGWDLPDELAELIRPLRRGAMLGPVAALACNRATFAVRDGQGEEIGWLRDDRVTVSRSGLIMSRFREVTLSRTGATPDQVAAIADGLGQVGGAIAGRFPSLVARLGAPATGASDFPAPRRWHRTDRTDAFVAGVLGGHARDIVEADLAVRSGLRQKPTGVVKALLALRRDLAGLAPIMSRDWATELIADVSEVIDSSAPQAVRFGGGYFAIIDRLVLAARAPRLGALGGRHAGDVVAQAYATAWQTLRSRMDDLSLSTAHETWLAAERASAETEAVAGLARHVFPSAGKLHSRLGQLSDRLTECSQTPTDPAPDVVAGMEPAKAFAAGRAYERECLVQDVAREDLLDDWPILQAKLARRALRP